MKSYSEAILKIDRSELEGEKASSHFNHGAFESPTGTNEYPRHGENGVIVGVLTGFQESGLPLVDFEGNKSNGTLVARSTVALSITQIGCELVLAFERGDLSRPIILGCLLTGVQVEREELKLKFHKDKLEFSAQREIALNCGNASITLTRAGKILIRGTFLLSHSTGVNRIRGGSVQIN